MARFLLLAAHVVASLVLGLSLARPGSAGAEQYLCLAENSSGFSFNTHSGTWISTTFRTDDKYLIAPSKNPAHAFQVTRIGENSPSANCEDGFNEAGYLFCKGPAGEFKFNKKNGRFLKVFSFGYFNVVPGMNDTTDESSDTPYVQIGKCSPF